MAKIVVTGGAGYIGSVLVPMLLDNGHKVTVIDKFLYSENSLISNCSNSDFSIINGDVRNEDLIKKAISDAEFIVPLAALVGFPLCEKNKFDAISVNLDAIKIILKYRQENQKIIYPCTNSGYGAGKTEKIYTEESPIVPISLYGKTKVEAERLVIESGNSMSFRFATLFGVSPRMRTDLLVNDFVYRAVNDRSVVVFQGDYMRNYLHVRDAARAFVYAINNFDRMKGSQYNCGLSDANLSKNELCRVIQKHIPSFTFMEAQYGEDPDKRNYIVSNEKIEKMGFKPSISLDDGIEELIKAYSMINDTKYRNY